MPFLTVAGIEVRVVDELAKEPVSLYQGGRARSRTNALISTEDDSTRRRVLDCSIDLYDATEEATLRAACPRGVGVAIAGDYVGTGFTGTVAIGDAALFQWEDGGTLIYKTVSLHIEEV